MDAMSGSIRVLTSVTGLPVVGLGFSFFIMRPSTLLEKPTLPARERLISLLKSYKLDILSVNMPMPLRGKLLVVEEGDTTLVLGLSNLGDDNPPIFVSEDILTFAT